MADGRLSTQIQKWFLVVVQVRFGQKGMVILGLNGQELIRGSSSRLGNV